MSDPRTAASLPTVSSREALRRLAGLLARRRRGVTSLVAVAVAATATRLAGPALVGVVVDAVVSVREGTTSESAARTTIALVAGGYAAAALASAVFTYLSRVQAARVGESALAELRDEAFEDALDADIGRIEEAGTGELVARLTGDVDTLARAVQTTAPNAVLAVLALVFTVVAIVVIDVPLGLATLVAGVPATAWASWWYARHAPGRYRVERETHAELSRSLLEGYDGRDTIAAHRAGGWWRSRTVELGTAVVDAEMATTAARNRLRPAVRISLACSLVVVVVLGTEAVAAGSLSVGAVSALALYLVRAFDPVGALVEELDELQQALASLARIVGISRVPSASSRGGDGAAGRGLPPAVGHGADTTAVAVALRKVSFGYGDLTVLHAVDLEVPAGERLAVVGPSGAGKTSLGSLVAGYHLPWAGTVEVHGRPAAQCRGAGASHRVVLATQEPYAFGRSIADNVRVARIDATDREVHAALEGVGAWPWLHRLDRGADAVVGRDLEPTPAQVQHLALARVVLAAPSVVVMDEATAALDPASADDAEAAVVASLPGATILTIAHRRATAARADRVAVVDDGRIVELGSHDELMARSGTYRELWSPGV